MKSDDTSRSVAVIAYDCETVPDRGLYDWALGEGGPDWAGARAACERGDASRAKALLGPTVALGNIARADTLQGKLGELERDWQSRLIKEMSVDPTRAAICCAGLAWRGAEGLPRVLVASWGPGGPQAKREEEICGQPCILQIVRPAVHPPHYAEASEEQLLAAEAVVLGAVWAVLGRAAGGLRDRVARFATFNGTSFDLPLLEWRTARHGLRRLADLRTRRYETAPHLDIAQVVWRWDRQNMAGCGLREARKRMGLAPSDKTFCGSHVYDAICEGRWGEVEAYQARDALETLEAGEWMVDRMGA